MSLLLLTIVVPTQVFPCWDYVHADQQGTARMGCCSRSARRCVLTAKCRDNLPSDPGALEMELSS